MGLVGGDYVIAVMVQLNNKTHIIIKPGTYVFTGLVFNTGLRFYSEEQEIVVYEDTKEVLVALNQISKNYYAHTYKKPIATYNEV